MKTPEEFHYRLPRRFAGWRPGSHPGLSLGAGQEFVSHASLHDRPDPRRLDLRASLRNLGGDWLVRVHRQRVSTPVHAVVDVSASMHFGSPRTKLQVCADFIEALGHSAFRAGDAVGMLAFDAQERADLFVPAVHSRGAASLMASALASCTGAAGSVAGLEQASVKLAGRSSLIFLISDFHWPLDGLAGVLDSLAKAYVVPMVVWDPAELQPPSGTGLMILHDAESGGERAFWLRSSLRERWRNAVEHRRAKLDAVFSARAIRPFHMHGRFDGEALSQYFFEASG
ncbi:MAG: MxaS protein [Pseudomonadota bacterium]|nr:MxaS protein [Pseudomonadota bacterium]